MRNFNVRNTNSDNKKDKRAEKQKRLSGPMPFHRLGKKEEPPPVYNPRSAKQK